MPRTAIRFTVQVWRENGTCVAYAPELDISSCGDSVRQAETRLREAVALFLEESLRMGTLQEILSETGFKKEGRTYRPRRLLVRQKVRLAIPIAS